MKRLIDTRWSGHLQSARVIAENYDEIVSALISAKKNIKLGSTERATASGLLEQMKNGEFIFLNHFDLVILRKLDIANKILQSSHESINSALDSTQSVYINVYDDIKIEQVIVNSKKSCQDDLRPRRAIETSVRLNEYVITERIPSRDLDLHRIVVECVDKIESEFVTRFADKYTEIWSAMEALLPSSANFLDLQYLLPLFKYVASIPKVKEKLVENCLKQDDLEAECRIYKRILSKQDWSSLQIRGTIDMGKLCEFVISRHSEGAPILAQLYKVAITAGYASARVECLFSALTKIDSPQRRSMTTKTKSDLTILHFERKTLMSLKFSDFLKVWKYETKKAVI